MSQALSNQRKRGENSGYSQKIKQLHIIYDESSIASQNDRHFTKKVYLGRISKNLKLIKRIVCEKDKKLFLRKSLHS